MRKFSLPPFRLLDARSLVETWPPAGPSSGSGRGGVTGRTSASACRMEIGISLQRESISPTNRGLGFPGLSREMDGQLRSASMESADAQGPARPGK